MYTKHFSMRLITLALLLLAFPLICSAHVHLDKSSPNKNAVLSEAPKKIELWFSGKANGEWSKIEVTNSKGKRFDKKNVTNGNSAKHLTVDLEPLPKGEYDVKWNVISGDGHRIKGSLKFSVK